MEHIHCRLTVKMNFFLRYEEILIVRDVRCLEKIQLLFYLLQYMLLCAKFYHLLSILLLLHFLLNKYSKQFHVNVFTAI